MHLIQKNRRITRGETSFSLTKLMASMDADSAFGINIWTKVENIRYAGQHAQYP